MKKTVAEIRFAGQISIIEGMTKLVRNYYPSEFSHWNLVSVANSLQLYNGESLAKASEIIQISNTQFIYSVENPTTKNYFIDKYKKYYKMFQDYIETNSVSRIGIRNIELLEQTDKEYTLEKYNNIYKDTFLEMFSESKPKDFYDVINYDDSRIAFGPLAKKETTNNYWKEFKQTDEIKENMFLFDIDCFNKNIKKTKIINVLNNLFDKNNDLSDKMRNFFSMDK